MEYTIVNLFPTPVFRCNIGRAISQQEMDVVEQHKSSTVPNMFNETTIDSYILQDERLSQIKNFIDIGLAQYRNKILSLTDNVDLYITQSWLNYTEPGKAHHTHYHSNSIISGVFYLNAIKDKDKIHFFDGSQKLKHLLWFDRKEANAYNSDTWWLPAETGDLVLFPSTVHHAVEDTITEEVRVSLAFNVFVKGTIGLDKDKTELKL